MRVESVSFVFHLALKMAGMTAQTAPAAMPAITMSTMSRPLGSLPPRQIMHAAAARPPASTWPSAPMFQKRILNAGVTASEMHSRMARFCPRIQILRGEPNAPLNMVPNTLSGLRWVHSVVMSAHSSSASTIAIARMPQA